MSAEAIVLLRDVRAAIADPARYTPDAVARDATGQHVPIHSPEACRWSVFGALAWRSAGYASPVLMYAAQALRSAIGSSIGSFIGTHAEALRIIDAAIASLTETEESTS